MKKDLLRAAARALDDQASGAAETASFTRARVLASLHQSRIRRRTRWAFALPLAASFAAATAWGTVSGHAPFVIRSVAQAIGLGPSPPIPAPPDSRRLPSRKSQAPSSAASPKPGQTPSPVGSSLQTSPDAISHDAASAAPATRRPNARPRASSAPAADRAHSLYLAAHGAHFAAHDFERALSAWQAYLDAAPSGRFAPEARYNRALCLARLGRHEEASAALSAFADAPLGSYRKEEATELRSALSP